MGASPRPGGVPVQRAELVTEDMDMLADLIRELDVEHAASFRCPDSSRVDGRMRAATVNGLSASLFRYDGFAYPARVEPVSAPMAVVCIRGSGEFTSGRDCLSMAPGRACLPPFGQPCVVTSFTGEYATLQVSWNALRSLAEKTGGPGGELRFESKAPVSAAREHTFFKTVEFICGQLVTSGTTDINPLIAREMTRLAAAAFLETFPNTTMTDAHLELRNAEPGEGVTVAGVARKWGWTSPAPFAETYRQRSAASPGWSLRT